MTGPLDEKQSELPAGTRHYSGGVVHCARYLTSDEVDEFERQGEVYRGQVDAILKEIGRSADVVFADPPYNIGIDYHNDPRRDRLPWPEFTRWLFEIITGVFVGNDVYREDGSKSLSFLLLVSDEVADRLMPYIYSDANRLFEIRRKIVWYERFAEYTPHNYTGATRTLLYLVPKGAKYKDLIWNGQDILVPSVRMQMGDKRAKGSKGKVPDNVWQVRRLQGTSHDRVDWHGAQIAPEPLERIVKAHSNPGGKVADLFAGSGSLGVVANRLGRTFIGVDGSPRYCNKIVERLEEALERKA